MKNIKNLKITTDKNELTFIQYENSLHLRVNDLYIKLSNDIRIIENGTMGRRVDYILEPETKTLLEEILLDFIHGKEAAVMKWKCTIDHQVWCLEIGRSLAGTRIKISLHDTVDKDIELGEYAPA